MDTYRSDLKFRPVQGKDEKIKATSPIDGYVYFATDTKKIYCGKNGEFVPMGGNSGVYYGNRPLTDDEKYGDEVLFTFSVEQIEGDQIPRADDLILNIPDGGFYRVLDVNKNEIFTQRLAISGGGSGGGASNEGSLQINYITPSNAQTITGVEYSIDYEVIAKDSAGDPVYNEGIGIWKINGKEYTQKVYNGLNSFQVDQYLDYSLDENVLTLTVRMDTGGTKESIVSKKWRIKAINLALDWNWVYDENNYISEDYFNLSWIPYGNIDCVTHIIFDNNMELGVSYFTKEILAKDTGKRVSSDAIPSFSYGTHSVEMYLTAEINGKIEQTPSIKNEITFIKNGSSTILTVPYYETIATQYDTLKIPFMVYDPDSATCKVNFYVNDVLVSSDDYDRKLHYWPYTINNYGNIKLTIATNNGDSYKDIELIVDSLDLDINEVPGYVFSLKANEFSGNDAIKNWSVDYGSNAIDLSFSDNFDWENGGLQTETDEKGNLRKFIRIKNNTSMTINYNLFGNQGSQTGKLFKIIFKANNCYNYDAKILECFDKNSNVGIQMNAQSASFSSNQNKVTQQYCEDSYIEFETEIWPAGTENNTDRFMMIWVDGIPSAVTPYSNDVFRQNENKKITIGSEDCDVCVYLVKVYERSLNEEEHLENFIADAPNINEMLDRYNRNDILDNNGEISYLKLTKQNPDCRVHLYEIPRMTQNKKDEVKNCSYIEYRNGQETPYLTTNDVMIKVQGTSSAAYGVAAFNIDSEFNEDFILSDGSTQNGYLINDNSIPINYTCTKVNVASCENANNALNQEWYNRFQPYHDAHRRRNEKARDCMEFSRGVMFIKDNNLITNSATYAENNVFKDTPGYVNNPYFKQYAICNMGNSKDNIEVFHDITNQGAIDEKVCCVEICDNQNSTHWMTTTIDDSIWIEKEGQDLPYEFRYPDGNDKATSSMKKAWIDFVNWMAECNPANATNEELPSEKQNIEYSKPYTFKGFAPPGVDNSGKPFENLSVLKGSTINTYININENGEYIPYTHDTYEYRMAKMLHECEEHLVMDSIVYHYLFIERHTMVDNVAKNTFWSTEDLQHWDLTKNYDNDTADGNNNTGYLVFSYGIECFDKETEVKYAFNAHQSVWLNFIHGLYPACRTMYQHLHSLNAWDSQSYLNEFKAFQNAIPERCWIYDYFRKYIRPRRLNLDNDTYLKRLEGGKKTHQREQYEVYQNYYIDSKYQTGKSLNNKIEIRANTGNKFNENSIIPITTYIDCYAFSSVGGQIDHSRIKRNEVYNVPVGQMITSANDSTAYFYNGHIIQTMQGLPDLFPQYIDAASANKLRIIELGSDAEGYFNENLTTAKFEQNIMLEKLLVQNSGISEGLGSLNLKNVKNLKELRINGSTYSGLEFASGGLIETAYLNNLSSLSMIKLKKLKTLNFDSDIYNTLKTLHIEDSNIDSYDLVLKSPLIQYFLTNVDWIVSENSLNNNILTELDVLKNLEDRNAIPEGTNTTAAALTGKILIDFDCNVSEYDIYEKYAAKYPNLIISYSDKVTGLIPAIEIKFLTNNSETAELHYRVLSSGNSEGDPISTLISDEGPLKTKMTIPGKEPTISHTYTFTGYWIDKDTNKKYYNKEDFEEDYIFEENSISFEEIIPTQNMVFYPEFIEEDRIYTVKFFDWNNNVILQDRKETYEVKYNKKYDGPIKNFYYRDSLDLKDDERWAFQGWSVYKYGDLNINNAKYTDVSNLTVTGNVVLYSHHVKENCKQVASNEEYFKFNEITIDGINGYSINIQENYRQTLQGKITIPSKYNNINIIQVGDFLNTPNITHIYFMNDSECIAIGDTSSSRTKGFRCENFDSLLQKVFLPNSIRIIGTYAFTDCFNLTEISLNNNIEYIGERAFGCTIDGAKINSMTVTISELPLNLKTLSSYAFYQGGPNITISQIPEKIVKINDWCFAYCPNLRIEDFGVSENSQLTTIGTASFSNSGKNVTYIHIGKKVVNLKVSDSLNWTSFYKYGSERNGNILQLDNDISTYLDSNGNPATSITQLGFESNKWSTSINY